MFGHQRKICWIVTVNLKHRDRENLKFKHIAKFGTVQIGLPEVRQSSRFNSHLSK